MSEMIAVSVSLVLFLGCTFVLYITTCLCYGIGLGILRLCNVDVSGIESRVRHTLNKFIGD